MLNEVGLKNIEEQFKDLKSLGPVSIAGFMGITEKDERNRITRDAFDVSNYHSGNEEG